MNPHHITALSFVALILASSATVADDSFYIGLGAGQGKANELDFTDFDDGSGLAGSFDESDVGWQIVGGYRFSRNFALELGYFDLGQSGFDATSDGSGSVFAPGPVTGSVASSGPGGFAVGIVPIGERFEVLFKAGYMAWNADVTVSNSAFGSAKTSESGSDLAFGAGAAFRFNDHFSVRGDWTRFSNIIETDGELLSLSAVFSFGGKSTAPAPRIAASTDIDGDGVPDERDECPATPAGQAVDAQGCARDGDGDKVPDAQDDCPNTIPGATVDAAGCELDGDSDGVVNRLDECPNTMAGVRVDVKGCEIQEIIELPGVNFETNSDQLLKGSEAVLKEAAATLQKYPDLIVVVAGHTDSEGDAGYNRELSTRRANVVRDFLVAHGANAASLSAVGLGEMEPVADNSTADGRARNRRVELRVSNR